MSKQRNPTPKKSTTKEKIVYGVTASGLVATIAVFANITKIYEFFGNRTAKPTPENIETRPLQQNDSNSAIINNSAIDNSNIIQGEGSSAKIINHKSNTTSGDDNPPARSPLTNNKK